MNKNYYEELVRKMISFPSEVGIIEFKENNSQPKEIGEYISALANAAALSEQSQAYMVWGITDGKHEIVGTQFYPFSAKGKGNEDLIPHITKFLSPRVYFSFHDLEIDGKHIVLLEIDKALSQPVKYKNEIFIRVGNYKKPIREAEGYEAKLWSKFQSETFEEQKAIEVVDMSEVIQLLRTDSYYLLQNRRIPDTQGIIKDNFLNDSLLKEEKGKLFITNLAALLFARDLSVFPSVKRKSLRIIQYDGIGKLKTLQEREQRTGYATGFDEAVDFILRMAPRRETIDSALRKDRLSYPIIALRELLANSLIHQQFSITGTGPMVEIFDGRIEFTNPGKPVVETTRFLSLPPKSRNEELASMMRRLYIAEERGSGFDKVVAATEEFKLPAPLVRLFPEHTQVTLFAYKDFEKLTRPERLEATFLHASLKYYQGEYLTNASLRERFGLPDSKKAVISKLIKEAVELKMIEAIDLTTAPRYMKYRPVLD